jgi:hypothetical protein
MDLTDIYRVFHPVTQYTLFLAAYRTSFKIDHILCHKARPNKFSKIEIIPCILPDHNTIKIEVDKNLKKKAAENT